MANFASLSDMRKKEEEEKKAKGNGKGTESYVGGERSGLAVENPDDEWKRMQEHAMAQGPSGPTEGARQITMYRNGFTIDGGPLRPLSDPLNKKFLDDMAKGQIPDELRAGSDEEVPVSVTDKRGEDYSESSALAGGVKPRAAAAPARIENAVAGGDGSVAVDAAKPTTKIQIRFHDGSRKAQEFNQDHTVGDLRSFCAQVTGVPMTVKGGYPPRPLTEDSQTLKDAGLCGAAVTVAPA